MSDLRGALMCIDPTLDADTLDWNLSLAFQVSQWANNCRAAPQSTCYVLLCMTFSHFSWSEFGFQCNYFSYYNYLVGDVLERQA